MDYVDELTIFGEEEGMRIDNDFHFDPTVYVTDVIDARNVQTILRCIGFRGF